MRHIAEFSLRVEKNALCVSGLWPLRTSQVALVAAPSARGMTGEEAKAIAAGQAVAGLYASKAAQLAGEARFALALPLPKALLGQRVDAYTLLYAQEGAQAAWAVAENGETRRLVFGQPEVLWSSAVAGRVKLGENGYVCHRLTIRAQCAIEAGALGYTTPPDERFRYPIPFAFAPGKPFTCPGILLPEGASPRLLWLGEAEAAPCLRKEG